jgi:hypothetical protein
MLVYTKTRVAGPSFLFTIGTVTRVIVVLLTLLRLTSFLSLYIGLKHGLHKSHALIAPKLCVGLLGLRGLTFCRLEGLTIAVIAMAVQDIVYLLLTFRVRAFTKLVALLLLALLLKIYLLHYTGTSGCT